MRYVPSGIRVNAIAPGILRTPAWEQRKRANPEVFERLTRWYPLGRVGGQKRGRGCHVSGLRRCGLDQGRRTPRRRDRIRRRPKQLNLDLDAYEALVPDTSQLGLVLRPMPPACRSGDNLAAKIALARERGLGRLDFYHYGFCRLQALDWMRQALAT